MPYNFGPEATFSFAALKQALTRAPVLSSPDPHREFLLDVDASYEGLGAVLSQKDAAGVEHVVEYSSKGLSPAKRNYCITRLELLALVTATKHFHHYLVGNKCVVRTDHSALTWLNSFRRVEGQLARWIESLQNYQLEIIYRLGRVHGNADALSRQQCGKSCPVCRQKPGEGVLAISSVVDWESAQGEDAPLSWIRDQLLAARTPEWPEVSGLSSEARAYWHQWESLHLEAGIVYCLATQENIEVRQLIVPRSHRAALLEVLHGGQAHVGIGKTAALCKRRFYWPRWRVDVYDTVMACVPCRRALGPPGHRRQCLARYLVGSPFARVEMDHYGPLTDSVGGHRYILVVVDCFTKWVEMIPVADTEAKTTARALIDGWISRFGVPDELHCDQGRGFESGLMT